MHIESEGPGTLGDFLDREGVSVTTRHLYRGDGLPADPREADLIVSLGGPMNVYEDEKHPFLKEEALFLRRAVDGDIPVLGICLGAQLLARACEAKVYRAPVGEVGWGEVSLAEEGGTDPLLKGLPDRLPVLQWHEDTFDIPAGGTLLASSAACPHQAFRVARSWGLQFHVEVNEGMLNQWFSLSTEKSDILRKYASFKEELNESAFRLYANFLSLAAA
jgi:GMP synthase (glutamine-hydrolysing)